MNPWYISFRKSFHSDRSLVLLCKSLWCLCLYINQPLSCLAIYWSILCIIEIYIPCSYLQFDYPRNKLNEYFFEEKPTLRKVLVFILHLPNLTMNRSSRLQMFFKIDFLKYFANFTGKHLCWSLFLIK